MQTSRDRLTVANRPLLVAPSAAGRFAATASMSGQTQVHLLLSLEAEIHATWPRRVKASG